jgi:hydroxypyruvate isomerase
MTIDRRKFIASAGIAAAGAAAGAALPVRSVLADAAPDEAPWGKTRFAANVEMWWGGKSFLDRLRAAHAHGYPAVEFWPWQGKPIDETRALCDELGLEIAQFTAWGFSPGLNDAKNHDRFVEAIEQGCEIAKKLRCEKMTVVGGNDQPGMTPTEMFENITTGLRRVAKIAERHQVMLILEPMNIRVDHKGHCLYGSPDAVRICRAVDSPMVKINWDLYHMQISEGDLCGRLREGFDQVGYLQLADHPGRHEPGTGEIHYNRVLKEAWDLGYRGYVGLECSPSEGEEKATVRVRAADVW